MKENAVQDNYRMIKRVPLNLIISFSIPFCLCHRCLVESMGNEVCNNATEENECTQTLNNIEFI